MFLVPAPKTERGVGNEQDDHCKDDDAGPPSSKAQRKGERDNPEHPFGDPDGDAEVAQSAGYLRGGVIMCWRDITLWHSLTQP